MTDAASAVLGLEPDLVHVVAETFEKMLGATVSRRAEGTAIARDVTAVVGFGGAHRGALAVSFAEDVACRVVSRLGGEALDHLGPDVTDGVGEVANIVAGRVKALLSADPGAVSMSLPTVVVGPEHEVRGFANAPALAVGFDGALGPFDVVLMIERQKPTQPRLLVAEDSRVMRKLLRMALKSLPRAVEVVEAETGSAAREILIGSGETFDLVCLDLHMPEVSGVAIYEALRRRPGGARQPVIVVTSEPDAEALLAEAERRAGVGGPLRVVKKPFVPDDLVRAALAVAPSLAR